MRVCLCACGPRADRTGDARGEGSETLATRPTPPRIHRTITSSVCTTSVHYTAILPCAPAARRQRSAADTHTHPSRAEPSVDSSCCGRWWAPRAHTSWFTTMMPQATPNKFRIHIASTWLAVDDHDPVWCWWRADQPSWTAPGR